MKPRNLMALLLALFTAVGCLRSQRPADRAAGGAGPEMGSTTAQASAPPEAAESLNQVERADKLIGEELLTSDHLRTGKVDNFVVDQESGQILYAVIGIGGILGVGETRVAVPPQLFTEAKKGAVQLNVDKRKLSQAPRVPKEGLLKTEDLKAPKADFLSNVYGYFGQKATWQQPAGTAQATFNGARPVTELTGLKVQNSEHQDLGTVETVMLDVPMGREVYLVLSPSSEMNLGKNYYALPPKAVKWSTDQKTLVTDLTRNKLANAPHFTKDDWSELSNTSWTQRNYQYYGQTNTISNSVLEPTGRIAPRK
jgi:sporulation protein YlmC with PRC-barrel domain